MVDSHDFLAIPDSAKLVFLKLILFGRRKRMWPGGPTSHNFPLSKASGFLVIGFFHIPTRKQSIGKLCSFGKRQHGFGHPYHPPFPTALFWPGFSLRKESNAKTSELLEEVENWKQKHLGQWRETCEQWKKGPFTLFPSPPSYIGVFCNGSVPIVPVPHTKIILCIGLHTVHFCCFPCGFGYTIRFLQKEKIMGIKG